MIRLGCGPITVPDAVVKQECYWKEVSGSKLQLMERSRV